MSVLVIATVEVTLTVAIAKTAQIAMECSKLISVSKRQRGAHRHFAGASGSDFRLDARSRQRVNFHSASRFTRSRFGLARLVIRVDDQATPLLFWPYLQRSNVSHSC